MTRPEALSTLALTEPFTAAALRLAYRRAAFHAHPDRGGDLAEMKRVNAAYEALRGPKRDAPAEPAPETRAGRRRKPPRYGGSRPEAYQGQLYICTWCRSVYRGETLASRCGCGGPVRRY
jgi:curved DNA-binding protein CbpA